MEVFGRRWQDYIQRIEKNWRHLVTDDDTVVIPGDISWALSLEESLSDMKFIDSLPGKKLLGKGNHDFWWSTMRKHKDFFDKNGITTISFLYNNAHEVEDYILAGTRGWYNDEDATNAPDNADFAKLTNREAVRLRMSLEEAKKLKENAPEKEREYDVEITKDGILVTCTECGASRLIPTDGLLSAHAFLNCDALYLE